MTQMKLSKKQTQKNRLVFAKGQGVREGWIGSLGLTDAH